MSKRKATPRKTSAPPAQAGQAKSRAEKNPNPGLDLKLVRDLARIANEYDLEEIEVLADGSVRVARSPAGPVRPREVMPSAPAVGTGALALVPPPPPAKAPVVDEDAVAVNSPFVGTFYRSPSPEADPFVEVGQVIRKGQVVCIVEAMKLMNEIEAETDGKVVEILAKNGDHVEYGQPLFRLAKL